MLLNNFFSIKSIDSDPEVPGKNTVRVEINEKHSIFEGHFPGMPVTPGVCLVQMVKEACSVILKKKLLMNKADNIKFIAIVNPLENKDLFMDILLKPNEPDSWTCEAVTYFDNKIFFKLKAHYSAITG